MNLFQAMLSRSKSNAVNSDHLPELNAFVDVAVGGKTESVPVEFIGRTEIRVRRPSRAAVGANALFNYLNPRGGFRFHTQCTAIDERMATFALPAEITIIEKVNDKRCGVRHKYALPLLWRYAPDGVGYGEFTKSTTVDISSAGLLLVVPRDLRVGTLVEIKLDLDGAVSPFVVVGALTRPTQLQSSGKFLAGICFKKISPTHANAIGDFIAKRQRGQRKRSIADRH